MVSRRKIAAILFIAIATLTMGLIGAGLYYRTSVAPQTPAASTKITSPQPTPASATKTPEPLAGEKVSVTDNFQILVPGGWRASVSTQPTFLAIQYARPGQINSLVYDAKQPAHVDYDGIPAWNGLTEHFYVRAITSSPQAFNSAAHAEVTSDSFTFTDGTIGKKYSVTKHATEAQKWGGLLKDSEWRGRVYVYEKNDKTIEAHLAYYPSTAIDPAFFEKIAATISIK